MRHERNSSDLTGYFLDSRPLIDGERLIWVLEVGERWQPLEIGWNGVESDEEASEGHDGHDENGEKCHRDGRVLEDASNRVS